MLEMLQNPIIKFWCSTKIQ